MRRVGLLLILFVFLFVNGSCGHKPGPVFNSPPQTQQGLPVSWLYSVKKISDSQFELVFKATINPPFHLYSQRATDDGPLPTEFIFTKSANYKLIGKTSEPKPIEKAEPAFDNKIIRYFENQAVFVQKIEALTDKTFKIAGTIGGMTCNESQCFPFIPAFDFEFEIKNPKPVAAKEISAPIAPVRKDSAIKEKTDIKAKRGDSTSLTRTDTVAVKQVPVKSSSTPPAGQATKAWYVIFILGFVGGFSALLTPCVFPMIPMTVSFFTKQSKTKAKGVSNALLYSGSIIILYVALGLGFTAIFGEDAPNKIATNVWVNLFFFVLLVVFAISFLGAFEIVLPSSFVNKIDHASDRGGLLGIFFMALTLAVVSFSCTSGVIGWLLSEAAKVGGYGPFWGMLGFSIALALPFGLFAAFPGWMNSLPKSGGWLNSVKVFLGFLELAFALKFASNADLVVQAGILTREVFLVIWIVIFALLGAYLMGWFKLSHDSDLTHLSVGRLMMAIFVFSFTIYLIPGLWGAPLKLISGVAPPQFYSESPQGFGSSAGKSSEGSIKAKLPEHAHLGPQNIVAFDDLKYASEYAAKVHKPVMVDFTGWACANCRRMEDQVWSDPEVKRRLNEDLVLVSLYVDDKNELPREEQIEVNWNGKLRTLHTIGEKWSYLQSSKYNALAQPQHRILSPSGERLSDSTGYDPDVQKYVRWLDAGVKKFEKNK